jgi:hypothetical protein
MVENKFSAAYRALMPLANNPHNRSVDNPAATLLEEIEKKLPSAEKSEAATAEKKPVETTKP